MCKLQHLRPQSTIFNVDSARDGPGSEWQDRRLYADQLRQTLTDLSISHDISINGHSSCQAVPLDITPIYTLHPARLGSWGRRQLTWQVCRRSSEDVIDKVVEGRADEGRVASSTLIEHAAKGPQICCTGVCRAILEQLWSHVAWGATLCLYHFILVSMLHTEGVIRCVMAAALMLLFGHCCCSE